MSYAVQKKLVFAFLGFYFIAGMVAVDQYPFFNWELFAKIPNEQVQFLFELRSFDGVVYDPALPFSESKFIFDAIGQSPTDYTRYLSELGDALERGDAAAAQAARSHIERIFAGKSFSYTVVKVAFDPIELWRGGTYDSRQEMGSFESDYGR